MLGARICWGHSFYQHWLLFRQLCLPSLKEPIVLSDSEMLNMYVQSKVPINTEFKFRSQMKLRKKISNKFEYCTCITKSTGLDNIGPIFLKLSANILTTNLLDSKTESKYVKTIIFRKMFKERYNKQIQKKQKTTTTTTTKCWRETKKAKFNTK